MSTGRRVLVLVLLALVMLLVLPGLVLANDGDGMVVMGTPVTIGPDEVHQGDVVSLGGPVEVAGEVMGDVVAVGDSIRVDGTVDGDVTAIGGSVSLGPHAVVRGDVNAIGGTLSRAPGAQILGRTSSGFRFGLHLIPDLPRFAPYLTPTWGGWRWPGVGRYFLYVAGLFALAVLVHALFPKQVGRWMQVIEADPWRTGMVGLVAMVLFYPAIFLAAITIVGIPVALAMVFVYALARLGGYVAVAMLLGRRILAGRDPLLTLGAGVLVLALLRYVPVIGWLAGLAVASLAIGAVVQTRFGTRDAAPSGPMPPGRTDGGA